jgi:hypothetical protein
MKDLCSMDKIIRDWDQILIVKEFYLGVLKVLLLIQQEKDSMKTLKVLFRNKNLKF